MLILRVGRVILLKQVCTLVVEIRCLQGFVSFWPWGLRLGHACLDWYFWSRCLSCSWETRAESTIADLISRRHLAVGWLCWSFCCWSHSIFFVCLIVCLERERDSQAGSVLSSQSPTWDSLSWTVRSRPEPKPRVWHLTNWVTQAPHCWSHSREWFV